MAHKALLIILDGWGIGKHDHANAIYNTPHPYYDYLVKTYPNSQLQASGENVGLPDGQMGNSEVGHLNIGGGRIVYQDLVKINNAIKSGSILENTEIKRAFEYCATTGQAMHFMGLTSTGGVHSSLDHLFALCDIAKKYNLKIPRDIMVVGFDNIDFSMLTTPSITTVSQPSFQEGYSSCELLVEMIQNPERIPKPLILNTELVIRESTASQ